MPVASTQAGSPGSHLRDLSHAAEIRSLGTLCSTTGVSWHLGARSERGSGIVLGPQVLIRDERGLRCRRFQNGCIDLNGHLVDVQPRPGEEPRQRTRWG